MISVSSSLYPLSPHLFLSRIRQNSNVSQFKAFGCLDENAGLELPLTQEPALPRVPGQGDAVCLHQALAWIPGVGGECSVAELVGPGQSEAFSGL